MARAARDGTFSRHSCLQPPDARRSVSDASELSAYSSVLFFGLLIRQWSVGTVIGAPCGGMPLRNCGHSGIELPSRPSVGRRFGSKQTDSVFGWDLYARLRRHHRPQISFLSERRQSIVRPARRVRSQQGTVTGTIRLNGQENGETTILDSKPGGDGSAPNEPALKWTG